jgi:SAM-dependent methyltransferase
LKEFESNGINGAVPAIPTMTTSPTANASNFFAEWFIYDQILIHNYMHHDEIFEDLRRFLAERYGNASFNMLDLGCGSARHLARALAGRSLSGYTGYDLSDEALVHAKKNLDFLECPVDLRHGDLLDGVKNSAQSWDLVFSSFALHHLTSAQKADFLASAYRRLKPNGICLMIDTMRDAGEDRPTYFDRYCAWLESRCESLSPEQLALVFAHIRAGDFPESQEDFADMATRAGFARKSEIIRYRWHHGWCLSKGEA